jgi:hypothetical protein
VGHEHRRGGPIAKDRIWFFGQFRDEGSHRTVPGCIANANFGDATKRTTSPIETAGGPGGKLSERRPSPDGAGDAAQQVQRLWDEQKPCQGAGFRE